MTLSRTSRVLLVLAIVAVAAYAAFELPRRRAAEPTAAKLFPPFSSAIDAVEIVRPGERVRAEVRGSRWEVVEPVQDVADYSRFATLIDAIARAEIARDLGPADDAAEYGLQPPAAVTTLFSMGDAVARVELGELTVDKAYVYARRDDGGVVLIPPNVLSAATLPADAYRDPHLVRFDMAEIEAFSVQRDRDAPIRWSLGDGWFTTANHDTVAGDSVEVPTYLRRFRGMRVRAFVPPSDTAGAFTRIAGRVTLHKRHAPALTMRFVAKSDSVYWCRVDGAARVVEVQGDVPGALDASMATLRDRRLLHFHPARAERIRVVTPDTSAVLVRAGDAWALPNPALGRIDPRAATDFVRALRALRYRRVLAGSGSEPATFTLAVVASGDTLLDEMRGRQDADSKDWIVSSRSTGLTAELANDQWTALLNRLRRLRTATR